jgi:hypothetical protein
MARKRDRAHKRKAIIVAGMHRSGTSAITRILGLAGAQLPKNLMPANPANEKGYWESMDLYSIHDEILSNAGTSWDDVLRFPEGWFAGEEAQDVQRRILAVLRQEFRAARLFVIKDPRISRLVPLWLRVLRQFESAPCFVLTLRHPLEVAASLKRRNGFTRANSLLLWLRHLIEAEKATRGQRRSFVSYDALLTDWRKEIKRIGRDLGISWPALTPERCAEIDTFLSASIRHHRCSEKELDAYPEIGQWVKRLYRAVLRTTRDGSARVEHAFDVVDRELESSDAIYGPIVAGLRADAVKQINEHNTQIGQLTETIAERDQQIASLSQAATERDQRIASLSQAITERDQRIASLSQAITERDQRIASLSQVVTEREGQIASLNEAVAGIEGQMASLIQEVRERDEWLTQRESAFETERHSFREQLRVESDGLKAEIEQLQAESGRLKEIERSRTWRLTYPARRLGTILKRVVRSMRRKKHTLHVATTSDLQLEDSDANVWQVTGNKPQFGFEFCDETCTSGWHMLHVEIEYDSSIKTCPSLHFALKTGTERQKHYELALPEEGLITDIIPFPSGVCSVVFRPSNGVAMVRLGSVWIREIGQLEALARTTLPLTISTSRHKGAFVRSLLRL